MLPLLFGPPMQPSTPLPPQVAVAYAVFTAFVCPGQGEAWKSDSMSPTEIATRDAALLTLRQFVNGENFQPKAESDFAKAGICEWDKLPAQVRKQLHDSFPPNWSDRMTSSSAVAEDVARFSVLTDAKTQQLVETLAKKIALEVANEIKPKRRKAPLSQP